MIITKRCNNWHCSQKAVLRPTGYSADKPQWYCIVCKTEYFDDGHGGIATDIQFEWKVTPKEYKTREVKNGVWRDVK
jgi:hypothetical protein